jgi:uncharacterized membrane protein (DUF485 family)
MSPAEPTGQGKVGTKTVHEIIESPDFKALVARRWSVSIILTILLFVVYYGYILLIASDKAFVSQKVGEVTTLAIPLGVGVIIGGFVLTAIYVVWANAKYDPMVTELKSRLIGNKS